MAEERKEEEEASRPGMAVPSGSKRFSLTDAVVLVIGECLAVPFCIAAGEAFVNEHFRHAAVGFGIGIPLAIAAPTFSLWKGWLGDRAQQAITRHATWWLPLAVLIAFAYAVGPDMYRRAMQTPDGQGSDRSSEAANNLIESLQSALASTRQTLEGTRNERDQAKQQLVTVQSERDQAQQALDSMWKEIGLTVDPIGPSPLLKLTDAKRWRFIKSFLDSALRSNGERAKCSAAVSIKPESGSANTQWAEFQTLLSYSNWQVAGGGPGSSFYKDGITILISSADGDPFICATKLTQALQDQTSIPVSIRKDQVTPILEQCKNECVEIQIGDGVVR